LAVRTARYQHVAVHVFHLEHGARDQLALADDLGEIPSAIDDDGEANQQEEGDDVENAAGYCGDMDQLLKAHLDVS